MIRGAATCGGLTVAGQYNWVLAVRVSAKYDTSVGVTTVPVKGDTKIGVVDITFLTF
jgi:hypothetical protein